MILFVHFGAASRNRALKERVRGCDKVGEMFQSEFCTGYRANLTPFWRKLLGFVISAAERAASGANGWKFRPA